jgi:hypothetical protein
MGTKLILGILLAGLLAVPAAAKPSSTVAVGKVQGSEAFLAVIYDGHHVRAYACDGSARRLPTISAWFTAAWDGRSPITIVSGKHTLRLDGPRSGRLNGHRFTLRRATGPAGLYERSRETWVVLANGDIRGALIDPRPRKCRPVQVTLVDGTTQIVTVCKTG